ncbi:Hypothetical predicted protein [Mytilus galloprovincialis]|uniref:Uncharacterized protein n=1 Tax=Mytilus galloprovincialis TaxID=29158 RepID=A0A8B6D407_MYTGA|nr:Hypothetical predicted protein [Mytilus galloprovincialis]
MNTEHKNICIGTLDYDLSPYTQLLKDFIRVYNMKQDSCVCFFVRTEKVWEIDYMLVRELSHYFWIGKCTDSPKTDGKSEYEKFIWTIKMSSSEDEQEDITDQDCDAALMEFIAGTDFDKLLKEDFEMR